MYLVASVCSMYAGSAFVQAILRTDMDLTKEIELVREQRRLARQRQLAPSSENGMPQKDKPAAAQASSS